MISPYPLHLTPGDYWSIFQNGNKVESYSTMCSLLALVSFMLYLYCLSWQVSFQLILYTVRMYIYEVFICEVFSEAHCVLSLILLTHFLLSWCLQSFCCYYGYHIVDIVISNFHWPAKRVEESWTGAATELQSLCRLCQSHCRACL